MIVYTLSRVFVYTLSRVIVYSFRPDTWICPYDSHLSLKSRKVWCPVCKERTGFGLRFEMI